MKSHAISRSFAPKPHTYSELKNKENKKSLLELGVVRYPTVDSVIEEITTLNNPNPLFISNSSLFARLGPDVPESAQRLLASAYIKEQGTNAFFNTGNFDFKKFKGKVVLKSQAINRSLVESYFSNIKLKENTLYLAGPRSEYHCEFDFLAFTHPFGLVSIQGFISNKSQLSESFLNVGPVVPFGTRDLLRSFDFTISASGSGRILGLPYSNRFLIAEKFFIDSPSRYDLIYDNYVIGSMPKLSDYSNSQKKVVSLNVLLLRALAARRLGESPEQGTYQSVINYNPTLI